MRHAVSLALGFVLIVAAAASAGQSGGRPRTFEAGLQVATRNGSDLSPFLGPRFAVKLDERTSIEAVIDRQLHDRYDARDFYVGQLKRDLSERGNGGLFVTVGGVIGTLHIGGPSLPRGLYPSSYDYREIGGGVVGGLGYEQRVGSHLTVRADAQVLFSSIDNYGRVSVGVGVPFGPRARVSGPRRPSISGSGAARSGSGQLVVVTTTGGRTLEGRVLALDAASVSIRGDEGQFAFPLSDVASVVTADHLSNGAFWGAVIGTLGGLGMGLAIGHGYEQPYDTLFALAMTGGGLAGGALVGALGDSMVDGRRELYRAGATPRVTMRSIITPGARGVRAMVSW